MIHWFPAEKHLKTAGAVSRVVLSRRGATAEPKKGLCGSHGGVNARFDNQVPFYVTDHSL